MQGEKSELGDWSHLCGSGWFVMLVGCARGQQFEIVVFSESCSERCSEKYGESDFPKYSEDVTTCVA